MDLQNDQRAARPAGLAWVRDPARANLNGATSLTRSALQPSGRYRAGAVGPERLYVHPATIGPRGLEQTQREPQQPDR